MTDDLLVQRAERRTRLLLPPASCHQDKSPLITNCAIALVYINFSPTGYFSLLSGKHLSSWNYYGARPSGGTQTVVNLAELWPGLSSLDGQSTGGAEGAQSWGPLLSVKETPADIYISVLLHERLARKWLP